MPDNNNDEQEYGCLTSICIVLGSYAIVVITINLLCLAMGLEFHFWWASALWLFLLICSYVSIGVRG